MAQEIRSRFKEMNRKRPARGTDEPQSKQKRIQKAQTPQVKAMQQLSFMCIQSI